MMLDACEGKNVDERRVPERSMTHKASIPLVSQWPIPFPEDWPRIGAVAHAQWPKSGVDQMQENRRLLNIVLFH